MMSRILPITGESRTICPTMRRTPAFRHATIIRSASVQFIAIGFSTNTCFPAAAAASVSWQWVEFAETMKTASTSGEATRSSAVAKASGTPHSRAFS